MLEPADIGRLTSACRDVFDVAPAAEVTLEANPTSVDAAYFCGLLDAGVNRLSLGVQTLNRRGLRALGRNHEAAEAVAAFQAARQAGFTTISLDLIFGWAGQTAADWAADLAAAVALAPRHLSLYALTVEARTALAADIARGRVPAPDEDRQADFYEQALAALDAAGYDGYEISNWARRDPDGSSRRNRSCHNLLYWRNGEYLGFGVGAHSHYRGHRFANGHFVRRYIAQIEAGAHAPATDEAISPATAMAETMLLGLRLADGVSHAAFRRRHGRDLAAVYGPELADLAALGLLTDDGAAVRLTPRGRLVANEALIRFLKD
ncbi:MAG TPA: radical SAM family heme chaperone HemW [Thermomicrobiales bacterium]|nr:radical SAM family heme chaperone HemW [Thermomicrobiales bacterium]